MRKTTLLRTISLHLHIRLRWRRIHLWGATAAMVTLLNTAVTVTAVTDVWNGNINGNWDTTTANWLLGTNSTVYVDGNAVLFDDTLAGTTNVVLSVVVNPSGVTFNNSASNYMVTGAGRISGTTSVVKNGPGTVTLTETGGDNFGGGIVVNAGKLTWDAGNSSIGGGVTIGNPGTLQIGNGDGLTWNVSGGATVNGSLIFNLGAGTYTWTGISGNGTVVKQGASVMTFSNSSTNSVDISILVTGGTLKAGNTNALGSANAGTTISSGGTLDINAQNLGPETITVSGSGVGGNGAIINSSGTAQQNALQFVTLAGAAAFGGTGRWDIRSSPNTVVNTTLSSGGNPYKLTKVGNNLVALVGVNVDPALGDIDIQQGTLSIEKVTTSLGNVTNLLTIFSGASLQFFQVSNTLNKAIVMRDAATIINNSGFNTFTGPITLSTNGVGGAGNCTLNIGGNYFWLNNGQVSGIGNLIKTGTGILYISGSNPYSGNTTINAGMLSLFGNGTIQGTPLITIASGTTLNSQDRSDHTLTLGSGQTLQGSGTVFGKLTAGAGSTVRAGTSTATLGTLFVSDAVTLLGTTFMKLNATTGTNDVLRAPSIAYGGTLSLTNQSGALSSGNLFRLFSAGSYSSGFSSILPSTPGPGLVWDTGPLSSGYLGVVASNALNIYKQPQSVGRFVGGSAAFSVLAGSGPLTYQWFFGTNALPGATNSALTLNNVQLANAGGYSCLVSNAFASVMSVSATLSVLAVSNSYPQTVAADSPLSYWRLGEGNGSPAAAATNGAVARDYAGGNDGVYTTNVLLGVTPYSIADPDSAASFGTLSASNSFVGAISGIDFSQQGSNAQFSIEAWVRGNVQTTDNGIVTLGYGNGGEQFSLDAGSGSRRWRFFVRDGSGTASTINGTTLSDGSWHHLVGVCDQANGFIRLYLDGVLNGSSSIATGAGVLGATTPLTIGARKSGIGSSSPDLQWVGSIDDVAVYNYALSGAQITNHYQAGLAILPQPQNQTVVVGGNAVFTVGVTGAPLTAVQWSFAGTNLVGATSTSLTVTNVQLANAGYYRALVTTPYWSDYSAFAGLGVNAPLTNSNGTVTAPSGMIDWWAAEGNTLDSLGGNHGTPVNTLSYGPGKVGSAFQFDGTNTRIDLNASNVPLPWTVTAWVNRQNSPNSSAALMGDANFSIKLEQFNGTRQVGITTFGGSDLSFGYVAPVGTWVHLAFVANGTNTLLYTNGVLQGSLAVSAALPRASIGADFNGALDHMAGGLDELAIFNRALSGAEVASLYSAGAAGQFAGPVPPGIIAQPQNQTNFTGATVLFSVQAYGSPTLAYQWQRTGTNLSDGGRITGSFSNVLAIANMQPSDAASYRVIVTNTYGSVTSTIASLTVPPGTFTNLVIETPSHHLGDDPGNEGTFFQKTFVIPGAFLTATLNLDFVPPVGPNFESAPVVSLNGVPAGSIQSFFPPLSTNACWQTNPDNSHDYNCGFHVSLPVTSLVSVGTNVFQIANGRPDDDYYFANVSMDVVLAPVSLQAYLRFDEGSGTTAADFTGNGWNGTLINGAGWTSGVSNSAVSLNGASQYVSLPAGVVSGLTDFSVTAWVKQNSVGTWSRIFDFGNNTTINMFLTPQSSAGGVRYAITTNTLNNEQQINGVAPIPAGGWHHVAVTLGGLTGILYVDGVAVGTNNSMTLNPSALGSTTQNWIGRSQYTADPYFNAAVDEFRIYSRALSASEVQALVTVSAPAITAQPTTQTVVAGTNAIFTVAATGSAPLGYQWQFNGVNLSNGGRISGVQSSAMTISAAQFADEGLYRVILTNGYGSVTSAAPSLIVNSTSGSFVPIVLTSNSYNQDMVVENTAQTPLVPGGLTTATMDQGTLNTAATWYERGFDSAAPATGLPIAGSTNLSLPNHSYVFAPSYASNNAILIDATSTSGSFKPTTPGSYGALSFLTCAGNSIGSPVIMSYTVRRADGTQDTGTIPAYDYFPTNAGPITGAVSVAFIANGRADAQTFAFNSVNSSNPAIYAVDIALGSTNSPITNIAFAYVSGSGHAAVFGVSGAASTAGLFTAINVTGYNRDMVMEASAAPSALAATTASMDAGTGNTGNTWYERGYVPGNPSSGLPVAGSVFTNASASDRLYRMAPSYTGRNTVLVDSNSPAATLRPLTAARYAALSLLHTTANGNVAGATIQCVINFADGSSETNVFNSPDWFNNGPFALSTGGRVALGTRVLNNLGTTNPRLYFTDIPVANTNSPVTSLAVKWVSGATNNHTVIFGVSGVALPGVPPLITSQPQDLIVTAGAPASLTVSATGASAYQWSKDGVVIAGATAFSYTIPNAQLGDAGGYSAQVISSSQGTNSATAVLSVVAGPLSRNVAAGSKTVFGAPAAGAGPFAYQWAFNSVALAGATRSSLTLTNVQGINAGTWSVAVSNAVGGVNLAATLGVIPGNIQLASTNLVVIRVGDGAQSLTAGGNSAFLDQFDSLGSYLNTVAVPDSGPTGVVMSGSSFVEGYLTRSLDGRFLCFAAYGTNVGAVADVTTSTAVPRVVVTFSGSSLFTRNIVTSTDYSGLNFRSATTDGANNFWGAGSGGGTIYLGSGSPRAVVQNTKANCRVVEIFNGDLYMASASNGGDALRGLYRFSGLPNTATALPAPIIFTNTFGGPSGNGINDFAVSPSGLIIYFADDRPLNGIEGGIQRWDFDSLNNIWTNSYSLTNGLPGVGVSHLAVDWGGPVPVVYATTPTTSQNQLVKVADNGQGSPFALLATAGANQIFRGVKFGPVPDPAIIAQPQSLTNTIGSTATFSVGATGTPPLTYQWQKNGTNLAGATLSSLTFSNVSLSNAGSYVAIVSNPVGNASSVVATLSVGTGPVITNQPQNQVVGVGGTASFSAGVSGSAPLSYQWQQNGVNVFGATQAALSIANATLANAGTYRVLVSNPFGSAVSSNATLSVFTVPNILQPPVDAQVIVGGSVTFSVLASSSGPLAYQWSFNGSNILAATGSAYTVNNAQLNDSGDYSVQVANAALAASATAALLVVPAPPPVTPPVQASYSIQVRSGLNLIANQVDHGVNTLRDLMPAVPNGTVVSKYDNLSGAWIQDTFHTASNSWAPGIVVLQPGEGAFLQSPSNFLLTITGDPHVPVLPVVIPPGVAWLVSRQTNDIGTYENITGLSPSPGAVVYQWNPTNSHYITNTYSGSGWSPSVPVAAVGESLWIGPAGGAPVPLPDAPVIIQQPTPVSVAQGGTAIFTVIALGSDLQYQWRLNENNIPGASGSTLTISNVQPANAGNYSVVVFNVIGVAISTNAPLTVTNLPPLPSADNFANAGNLGSANTGTFSGSTIGATIETGEHPPANITGGASIWLRWQPLASGLATFTTAGSDFDTLLAVYTGSSLATLHSVAADDDSADFLCSRLGFNAVAGTTYFVQIDGFYGVSGHVVLAWSNTPTTQQAPEIVTQPQSQTVPSGVTVLLTVVATNTGSGVSYQWTHDGTPVASATDSSLTLSGVGIPDAGLYRVGITNLQNGLGVLSMAANIQIFDPGLGQAGNPANVALQDKFPAANDLTVPDPNSPRNPVDDAVLSGYGGTITAGGTGAYTVDPGETEHCGYAPHKSVWGNYSNNVSGRLTISTRGTTFNAVLAVYTGPDISRVVQVPGGCSSGHGVANGEAITVDYTNGINYRIVIQPVNTNDSGTVVLNYSLVANAGLATAPVPQIVTNGAKLTLTAVAVGTPPVTYQWRLNGQDLSDGSNMSGTHSSSLTISNMTTGLQGQYTLIIANGFSTNESAPAMVFFGNPPQFIRSWVLRGIFNAQLACLPRTNYVIEASSDLKTWSTVKTSSDAFGYITFTDPITATTTNRFYRARKL